MPSLRTITRSLAALSVGAGLAFGSALAASPAAYAQDSAVAQQIANHFASVRSMRGEFVQFGPRGQQIGGTFAIERPGKVRFDYEDSARFEVIADGKNLAMNNEKLGTYEIVPLSQTPLKLLLDDRIDLSGGRLKSVKQDPDLTTIVMGDRSVFGNATITMMFDPNSYDLRQWTVTDAQGKDTTVMLFNVSEGVDVADSQFTIEYNRMKKAPDFGN